MSLDSTDQAGGATILVIDDEAGVRMYCRRILEAGGASVVEARDGEAALRLLENGADGVDMVITDLLMPRISGREVVQVLAAFRPELPVLAISADPGVESDRRLQVLRKPFTPDQLLKAVARARVQARHVRSLAQERRAQARQLQDTAARAQRRAKEVCARVDLVAAVIELRRAGRSGSA